MNFMIPCRQAKHLRVVAALALLLTLNATAVAAPGAHGPNGEHLDAPATAYVASTLPRLEAQTESFELVAQLRTAELVIVVDRYETNEPVLGAKLEVESGGLKAVASFRPDQGDYAVTDAALLAALTAPGEHPLVFTLVAGAESDLLDGTLVAAAGRAASPRGDHGHSHDDHSHDHELGRATWIGGGISAMGLLGGIAWWRRRRSGASTMKAAL